MCAQMSATSFPLYFRSNRSVTALGQRRRVETDDVKPMPAGVGLKVVRPSCQHSVGAIAVTRVHFAMVKRVE
jgi:hypothetical protein